MLNYKIATKDQLKDEFKRLSDLVSDTPFGTKKEFFHLPQILSTDETPLAIASGSMDGNTWLITLTNHRVIFLDKGMLYGLKQIDVNLKDIASVGGKTGMLLGDITISTSGQNYTIKNVQKTVVIPFTNLVNKARGASSTSKSNNSESNATSPNDLISQIERLAALKEKGILSEEEFQQQKSKLLNA